MQNIGEMMNNYVLWVALLACVMAQVFKILVELVQHGKINLQALFTSGGMPSAHSAFVAALAVGVGQTKGWSSPEFALAFVFAIIVMYDAAGVRQAAGLQAKILNQILDELFQEDHHLSQDRLKELLGHTPVQVIAGFCLGVAVSWLAGLSY
ncbi:MAG: divergent PAP2 family protein [Trichodesmium sp.]